MCSGVEWFKDIEFIVGKITLTLQSKSMGIVYHPIGRSNS